MVHSVRLTVHFQLLKKGAVAFTLLHAFDTREVQQFRDEVLAVTPEKVRAYAPTMKAIMDQNAFVVIGNDTKIETHKGIFKNIRNQQIRQ